jgi:SET domain-containing protein
MVTLYPRFDPTENERHVESNLIELRKSTIPGAGTGVFCKQAIPSGTDLGYYRGEEITPDEHDRRHSKKGYGEYVLMVTDMDDDKKQVYIDGKTHNNWISRVNAPKGTGKKPNIYWDAYGHVFSSRNIKAGEELFANYGAAYWRGKKNGTRKVSKTKKSSK